MLGGCSTGELIKDKKYSMYTLILSSMLVIDILEWLQDTECLVLSPFAYNFIVDSILHTQQQMV